jgi:hypothetical protein
MLQRGVPCEQIKQAVLMTLGASATLQEVMHSMRLLDQAT